MSLMQEMSQRALDLGVPMSVHFDITYRCTSAACTATSIMTTTAR